MDDLLADDPDDAEALDIRQQLLDSIAALGAATEGGDTAEPADPTADASPPDGMIGPSLPPHAASAAAAAASDAAAALWQHDLTLAAAPSGTASDQPAAKRQRVASAGSGNARMHPANCYADAEPDFVALAALHPALASYVHVRSDGRCAQSS